MKAGMIGVHVGMVVPLIMLVGAGMQAAKGTPAYLEAKAASPEGETLASELSQQLSEDPVTKERLETLEKNYQQVGLWGIAALSLFATSAIVMLRPRPSAAPQAGDSTA